MAILRPDPDHDRACQATERHQVISAPPGTGKTCLAVRLAGERAGTLSETGRVLLLTFSNQARTQLEREAARQLGPDVRGRIEITNYHRFFWAAVNHYRRALGLPEGFRIVSMSSRLAALAHHSEEVVKQLSKRPGLLESLAECSFPEFHDGRTPDAANLPQLLEIVRKEHAAGRLVFDDLGALFWTLLQRFPSIQRAYRLRFPYVIADEHQDASAIQDAVVRLLGTEGLVILADPLQLIHGYRGADPARLDRHVAECDHHHSLRTHHRWHDRTEVAAWFQGVREHLTGNGTAPLTPPDSLVVTPFDASRGFLNAVKPFVRDAVRGMFRGGLPSIAVIARTNKEVSSIRDYLSRQGLFPRQVGGGEDFEEACSILDFLQVRPSPSESANRALDLIVALVPTLQSAAVTSIRTKLTRDGVDLARARSLKRAILQEFGVLYEDGTPRIFRVVSRCLSLLQDAGYHVPRRQAANVIHRTAAELPVEAELDEVIDCYYRNVLVSTHAAPRDARGLFVLNAHQAKGREFSGVVLVNASASAFPDTDDGRLLFYVALTRGMEAWTVLAPESRPTPLLGLLE